MIDLRSARMKPGYQIAPHEVVEPDMSETDWQDFERGIALFNRGEYWESHEAWELVWRRHLEPSRIFFQGLIQLAAAYHQLGRGIFHGVIKHFNNAGSKLGQFPDVFLGLDVKVLKAAIRDGRRKAEALGEENLKGMAEGWTVQMRFVRPD